MHGGINRIGAGHIFRKILAGVSHRLTVKKQPIQKGPNISPGQFIEDNAPLMYGVAESSDLNTTEGAGDTQCLRLQDKGG
jgi:hypothetical protein